MACWYSVSRREIPLVNYLLGTFKYSTSPGVDFGDIASLTEPLLLIIFIKRPIFSG